MKYREITRIVEKDGWLLNTQKGSHKQFIHPTKPGKVTVAGHPSKDVPPMTLHSILRQAQIHLAEQNK